MKRFFTAAAITIAVILTSNIVIAEPNDVTIKNLPNEGQVTLNGTVEQIGNDHTFTLRNDTGIIEVHMIGGQNMFVKKGDNVVVKGTVHSYLWGIAGKDIVDASVQITQATPSAS